MTRDPLIRRVGPREGAETFCEVRLSHRELKAVLRAVQVVGIHAWLARREDAADLSAVGRRLYGLDRENPA